MNTTGTLFIVATPIGNLKDITYRAVEVLSDVDIIACEDTRHTKILLEHYQIKKPLISYYEYNKIKRTDTIIAYLKDGKNIALVSDAGTPGISDPGAGLIKKVLEEDLKVEVIPGPTAFIPALVASGLPTHKFIFEGFLPAKSGARKKHLERLKEEKRTLIFYESPHRICRTLEDIKAVFGSRHIVIARELTKKFEEIIRAPADAVLEIFKNRKPKGEFIILV